MTSERFPYKEVFMKINPTTSFKAIFDKTRTANLDFLKNAYYNALNSERMDDFTEAKYNIKTSPNFTINLSKSSPQKDTFVFSGQELNTPLEVFIPKKTDSETPYLDSYVALSRIVKQLF